MFDLEHEIRRWKKGFRKYGIFEDGLIADLEVHLRDTYKAHTQAGLTEEEALRKAVGQVGTPEIIAAEYDKNRVVMLDRRSPLRPGRFMPALFWNCLKTALRAIRRQKGCSFINVSGLAIGLTVCMLIVLWVADEKSFDCFHTNASRIYRVYREELSPRLHSTSALTPPPMAAALKSDFPEISKVSRFGSWSRQLVTYENKSFNELRFRSVDPDFFEMFSFPLITGDPKNVFANPYSVVLTERTAVKYFGEDDPIGKILTIDNDYNLTVTGIIRNDPFNSSLEFDFLSPFDILLKEYIGEENADNWAFNSLSTYVMLEPSASAEIVNRKIASYLKKYNDEEEASLLLQPLKDIHLFSDLGHDLNNRGDIKYVWIFSSLAVFVLLIACVNFMNLTTARYANRAKEVGLRKVVGAVRSQLVRQFFGESILMAFLALGVAVLLLELFLPLFNSISGKELTSAWRENSIILLRFAGLSLITGIASGIYPAFFLSSFTPIRAIKGMLSPSGANLLFRKLLVVFQFTLSVFLIIGTLIISRQLSYMRTLDLGFNQDHIIHLGIHGDLHDKYAAIRERFLQNPDVLYVTASMVLPTNIQTSPGTPTWEGQPPEADMKIKAGFIDYDYIEMFEIPLVEGRSFSREYSTDSETAFIVNEEAVRMMGLQKPVVGKKFGFWNIDGRIIGVMKDAHFQSLHQKIEPLVFKMFPDWLRCMYVKIRSDDVPATLAGLGKIWDGMSLGYPFEYLFLDEEFHNLYASEERLGKIFRMIAALAVFVACLGLFGLAAYIAEHRAKEIGIRKVLGSSTGRILMLLNRDFLKWTAASVFIAWPVAYFVMKSWLLRFAYRAAMEVWTFLSAAGLALAVTLLTVSVQTHKAARANPAESLKHE